MDTLSSEERSKVMSRVKSRNTRPEMITRRLIYALGYRYRLHDGRLPGKPDLAFFSRRKAIFVHGCFWHQHSCPAGARQPKSKLEFWKPKLEGNVARDKRNREKLDEIGWKVLVVWECEIKDLNALAGKIRDFLEGKDESS